MKVSSDRAAVWGGRIVEATDDRVVFEPASTMPPTARALLGALAVVLGPVVALTWNAESVPPHMLLGVVLPACASYWTWLRATEVAIAWSRIPPLRSPLVVERTPREADDEDAAAAYRRAGDGRTAWAYSARSGARVLGPDRRRGLLQIRAYPGSDLRLDQENARAGGPESARSREMLVANLVIVGEEAMMVSYALLPRWNEDWHWLEYQDSAEAMAKGDGAPITNAPGSMRPLVKAIIRVFGSEPSESSYVPTIVWKDTPTPFELVLHLFLNAPLRLGAYLWMSSHADAGLDTLARLEMGLACTLGLLAIEAGLYVFAMRGRYIMPLNSWVAMTLREHSRSS
jgi:hypothetical protein